MSTALGRAVLGSVACFLIPTVASTDDSGLRFQLNVDQTAAPLEVFQDCAACPEMIVLPLGSFMMGALEGESRNPLDIYDDTPTFTRRRPDELNIIPAEHPRHRVEMDIPLAMGRNEVTRGQWMACVDAGGCMHVPEERVRIGSNEYFELGPNHPVTDVSFLDMMEYVAWLNAIVGDDLYRLPTEAEWEYAARAGTITRFAQGADLTAAQANFSRNGTEDLRGVPMPELVDRRGPVTVDELDARNAWGLEAYVRQCHRDHHVLLDG